MTARRRLSRVAVLPARAARPLAAPLRALTLREACERLAISVRTAERMLALGRFPIPALPHLSLGRQKQHRRFSSADVDEYLTRASTTDL